MKKQTKTKEKKGETLKIPANEKLPKVVRRRIIVLMFSGIFLGIFGTLYLLSFGTFIHYFFLLLGVSSLISSIISLCSLITYKL